MDYDSIGASLYPGQRPSTAVKSLPPINQSSGERLAALASSGGSGGGGASGRKTSATNSLKAGLGTHLLAKKVCEDLVKQGGRNPVGLPPPSSVSLAGPAIERARETSGAIGGGNLSASGSTSYTGSYFEIEEGCCVAFIDISGYSRLTTELTAHFGSMGGASHIKSLINPIVEGSVDLLA
ncbi:hypothetical protein HDU67_005127 [Dinochytrium kinnereticum]|nr:hypothetical protein HDU67_005127 [Dinochytrium kinnereticum]